MTHERRPRGRPGEHRDALDVVHPLVRFTSRPTRRSGRRGDRDRACDETSPPTGWARALRDERRRATEQQPVGCVKRSVTLVGVSNRLHIVRTPDEKGLYGTHLARLRLRTHRRARVGTVLTPTQLATAPRAPSRT